MSDFQQRSPRPDISPMEQTPPAASVHCTTSHRASLPTAHSVSTRHCLYIAKEQKRSGRHAQQVYCHYCCNQWQQKPKVRQLCRSNSDIRLAQNNFPRLSTRNLASFSFDLDAVTAPRKRPRY
ncbi:hypothetical protein GE21DRAFT_1204201 [Neurospora crassa]|nr:hypothetical protein B1D4.200 [imported] - Neurospora crassa [Neurospora crassa]KHE86410.1 hypothetical protein GE21DRAFT_1204201 [Neurospora crassa]